MSNDKTIAAPIKKIRAKSTSVLILGLISLAYNALTAFDILMTIFHPSRFFVSGMIFIYIIPLYILPALIIASINNRLTRSIDATIDQLNTATASHPDIGLAKYRCKIGNQLAKYALIISIINLVAPFIVALIASVL